VSRAWTQLVCLQRDAALSVAQRAVENGRESAALRALWHSTATIEQYVVKSKVVSAVLYLLCISAALALVRWTPHAPIKGSVSEGDSLRSPLTVVGGTNHPQRAGSDALPGVHE